MTLVIKFEAGLRPVIKHEEHDQKTHGSWATGVTSELSGWSPKDKVPAAPRNATGTTDKFWENWEHGVDGDQFVDLYRQYAGEMLGLPVPKSDKDVGGSENYLTQRGFGASSTSAVRNQTEAVLTAIANGRPQPTLYRGMAASDAESKALLEQFTNLKEGDTIDMPLVSTTRSLGVAQWYAADRSYTPSDTKVIMKIQEGAKGVSVNRDKSFYPSDFETITSGKFQVVGITTVTVPYWARSAVHARTFNLNRPGEDVVNGYRIEDPNDPSWYSKDSNDPAAKVRYGIIRDGANTGNFSKIETPTLKYTNDRQTSEVKDGRDITVNSWTQKPPTTFTIIEVKMIEPHTLKKGAELGMIFHTLFNTIPFIRDEEDVIKHGTHDQKTHGNWATGTDGLSVTRDKSSFEQKLILQNKKGEPLAYVQFQEFREKVDILYIQSYDSGKGYATKVIEELYSSMPKKEIYWGKTSAPESTHLAQKFSDKYGRTQFMPWGEGVIAGYEWGELYGDTTVKKHGSHDQKTHGNWARGGGGNGLAHRAVYNLQLGMPDPLKSAIYLAEENHRGQAKYFNPLEKPAAPKIWEYETGDAHAQAWKDYNKNFDAWAKGEGKRLESDLGKELLDGTKAGVQRYVNKITDSDWFTEAFGNGGIIGTPKVTTTTSNQINGSYRVGLKNGVGVSGLAIHKYNMQDELTILHELAHYATTINETNRFSSHGIEFARNHLYILDHAISPAYADGLEKAYREAGIPLGK